MTITNPNRPAEQTQAGFGQQGAEQAQGFQNFVMPNFFGQGMFASPMTRGVGNEFYSKLKTNLADVYERLANKEVDIQLIDMDNVNEPTLDFSSIVVAVQYKNYPQLGVAYHILLLEATGDKLEPVRDNYNGVQIEVLRFPSDAIEDTLLSIAREKVTRAFKNGPWHPVDAEVVPETFNPDDKSAVEKLAYNASLACTTELNLHFPEFADLNLAYTQKDSSLNIQLAFNHLQILDVVGHPMRSDVIVSFGNRRNVQQGARGAVNTGDKDVRLSELSGFIDLVKLFDPSRVNPFGAVVQQPQFGYGQPQQPQQFMYGARLVITNIASNYSYTLGSILLAIATSLAVRDNYNWMQAFRPTLTTGQEIDIHDIGAINIEANIKGEQGLYGTRINTKPDSFQLSDLGQLLGMLVQPGLMVSIDCPEGGPQTWYTDVFASAARRSEAAYRAIYAAANQLTDGEFSKAFPMGSAMFTDPDNIILNGTWVDRNNQLRDVRDIDHLAVANLSGEKNPTLIGDWADTFLLTDRYPLEVRLNARRKIISGLTNESAVFTGRSRRVTFHGNFIKALTEGIIKTGLDVSVSTPLSSSEFSNQRGVYSYANDAIVAPGSSFMHQGGFGYGAQQYAPNYGFGYQSRW